MINEITYICIKTHGTVIPNHLNSKQTIASEIISYLSLNSSDLLVTKFNIACPGKTGFNLSPECEEVSKILNMPNTRNNIASIPDLVTNQLLKIYEESIPSRIRDDTSNAVASMKSREIVRRDVATCSNIRPTIENNETSFTNKMFLSEENIDTELFSIEILNGKYKGQNMISRSFFESNDLINLQINSPYYQNYFDKSVWEMLSDNSDYVLKQISLFELFVLLKYLGINNVYIIDPSCAVNYKGFLLDNKRVDRLMTRQCYQYNWPNKNPLSEIIPVVFPDFRRGRSKKKVGGKNKTRKNKTRKNKIKRNNTKRKRKNLK
jgi:hypothetical protein